MKVQRPRASLLDLIRQMSADPREWCDSGIITEASDDAEWGLRLVVQLRDGRPCECRPLWLGADGATGLFISYRVGAEVLVLFPGGDVNAGVAVLGPANTHQRPADEWSGAPEVNPSLYVGDKAASREGVLLRTLLDDLSTYLGDLHTFLGAVRLAAGTSGSAVTDPAYLAAVTVITGIDPAFGTVAGAITAIGGAVSGLNASATALQTQAAAWKVLVDQSKAEGGAGPYASTHLTAQTEA